MYFSFLFLPNCYLCLLSLGIFHIHGNAADNDSINIPLQLQIYTAGKFPAHARPNLYATTPYSPLMSYD